MQSKHLFSFCLNNENDKNRLNPWKETPHGFQQYSHGGVEGKTQSSFDEKMYTTRPFIPTRTPLFYYLKTPMDFSRIQDQSLPVSILRCICNNIMEGRNHYKKGLWTVEEDDILMEYIRVHGKGHWNRVAKMTGLEFIFLLPERIGDVGIVI
ncbi:hypothetical protein HHK36_015583 [Tetracentron sinense]|uniref:Uncharacterized protein n=1 Tax=Tetracentron sinense TaxID=13715 RepID=A0A834Z7H0_TETSI|nr:hypothetical protein HHK36_015583 [Tetracentron sinense]